MASKTTPVEADEADEGVVFEKAPPVRPEPLKATVKGLEGLKKRLCKWPIGEPRDEDFGFCGRTVHEADQPYCDAHASIAYQQHRPATATRPEKLLIGARR